MREEFKSGAWTAATIMLLILLDIGGIFGIAACHSTYNVWSTVFKE